MGITYLEEEEIFGTASRRANDLHSLVLVSTCGPSHDPIHMLSSFCQARRRILLVLAPRTSYSVIAGLDGGSNCIVLVAHLIFEMFMVDL